MVFADCLTALDVTRPKTDLEARRRLRQFPLAIAGALHRNRRLSLSFGLLAVAGAGVAFGTPLVHLLFLDVPLLSRFGGINHMALLIDAGLAGLAV